MTEQELREQFEGSCSYRLEDGYEYVIRFEYFKAGYSLAQETIAELESRLEQNVDMSVVTELNETIKAKDSEINKWYREWYNEHTKSQKAIAEARDLVSVLIFSTLRTDIREKAKAWLENNR